MGSNPTSSSYSSNEAWATNSRWGYKIPRNPEEAILIEFFFCHLTLCPLPSVPLLEELLQLDLPPPVEDPPAAVELPAADAGVQSIPCLDKLTYVKVDSLFLRYCCTLPAECGLKEVD